MRETLHHGRIRHVSVLINVFTFDIMLHLPRDFDPAKNNAVNITHVSKMSVWYRGASCPGDATKEYEIAPEKPTVRYNIFARLL